MGSHSGEPSQGSPTAGLEEEGRKSEGRAGGEETSQDALGDRRNRSSPAGPVPAPTTEEPGSEVHFLSPRGGGLGL